LTRRCAIGQQLSVETAVDGWTRDRDTGRWRSPEDEPVEARSLPGSTGEPVRLETASGCFVDKRRNPRELAAIRRIDPGRVVAVDGDRMLLRWVNGTAGSEEPQAHAAAARWLRAFRKEPVPSDPLPLEKAFAKRIDSVRRQATALGLEHAAAAVDGLDPALFAGERVWCHRDFRPANWIWDGTTLTPIDFEHSRPDHPLVDLVKLATEVWPDRADLESRSSMESAFLDAYGPVDRAVLDGLIRLHGAATWVWAVRHDDPAFEALGRKILDRFSEA
jgi:hypothetical protein